MSLVAPAKTDDESAEAGDDEEAAAAAPVEPEKVADEAEAVSEAAPAEQPRGLSGLLANRRRPLLRRPGTISK